MKAEIDLDFCKTLIQSGQEQLAILLADKVLVSGETMDKQSYQKHQRITPALQYKASMVIQHVDFNSHNLLLWLPLDVACVQTVQSKFLPSYEHIRWKLFLALAQFCR